MQAARRRDGFDFTRRFSAGPEPGRVGFYLELGRRKSDDYKATFKGVF